MKFHERMSSVAIVCFLGYLFLNGCSPQNIPSQTSPENRTEALEQSTVQSEPLEQSTKPGIPEMPEEYVELAAVLIGECLPSPDEIRRLFAAANTNPFEEYQKTTLELEKLKISSSTLEEQRQNALTDFQDAFESLELLSQDPTEQNFKRFIFLLQKADSCPGVLAYIGKDYTKQPEDNNGRIMIDFDTLPSPDASEEYDVIAITNTGEPIQNAIFCITLENDQNESAKVYAFARQIENQWLYYPCPQGLSLDGNNQILRHTVEDVSHIKVEMFAHDFSTVIDYSYDAEERGKDQKKAYQTANLALRWQKRSPGFFSDYQREAYVRLSNVDLPPCDVKFDYYKGEKHHSIVWNMSNGWQQGQKTFTAGNEELTFEPEKIEITISFPDSTYSITKFFDID